MARVYVSTVVNARNDRVWARVRDFNGLPNWHPAIAESRLVGFTDTGNVFKRVGDLDLLELRTALGFGVRYKSPVGPIRVDLGFKVHRQDIVPGRPESVLVSKPSWTETNRPPAALTRSIAASPDSSERPKRLTFDTTIPCEIPLSTESGRAT